jgi:hypothetical protein
MENKKNLFEEIFKITYPIPVRIDLGCFNKSMSNWEYNGFSKRICLLFKITDFQDAQQYAELKDKLFNVFREHYKANAEAGYYFNSFEDDCLDDKKTIVFKYTLIPNTFFKKPFILN